MNVVLPPELEKFVEEEVRAGRYESPERLVEAAVSHLMGASTIDDFAPGELAELIAEGEADIARGDVIDGDEVFAMLRRESDEYRRRMSGGAENPVPRP